MRTKGRKHKKEWIGSNQQRQKSIAQSHGMTKAKPPEKQGGWGGAKEREERKRRINRNEERRTVLERGRKGRGEKSTLMNNEQDVRDIIAIKRMKDFFWQSFFRVGVRPPHLHIIPIDPTKKSTEKTQPERFFSLFSRALSLIIIIIIIFFFC